MPVGLGDWLAECAVEWSLEVSESEVNVPFLRDMVDGVFSGIDLKLRVLL